MEVISFLLIILATGVAAGGEARQAYVIQLKDGQQLVGFWDEKGTQSGGKVRVELDMPWMPDRQWAMISLSNVVSADPERPTVTNKRRQKGFEDAGQVLVNGLAVPRDKYDLALRARRMAGIEGAEGEQDAEAVEVSTAPPIDTEATEPGVAPPPIPGFFEQWGAHIGLLLVAVLLTGLVVRMAFLSGD
jgi:hypothetical protein